MSLPAQSAHLGDPIPIGVVLPTDSAGAQLAEGTAAELRIGWFSSATSVEGVVTVGDGVTRADFLLGPGDQPIKDGVYRCQVFVTPVGADPYCTDEFNLTLKPVLPAS